MELKVDFSFDAAHRIPAHPGKCAHLHGHTYRGNAFIRTGGGPSDLPVAAETGYLIDAGDVKSVVKALDHVAILSSTDPLLGVLDRSGLPFDLAVFDGLAPSVENIATLLAWMIAGRIADSGGAARVEITLWETPTFAASAVCDTHGDPSSARAVEEGGWLFAKFRRAGETT